MRRSETLLLSDYAGHAFTHELADELHARGHPVVYSYCATVVSPKGRLSGACPVEPVQAGARFDKYNVWKRLISELRYGFGTARVVWRQRPSTHVTCNMPVISLVVFWALSLPLRTRLVIWFQDAQSGIAMGVLGGGVVPRLLGVLEGFILRRASTVVAISPELEQEARRLRVKANRVTVLENWAPLDQIPMVERNNDWVSEQGLPYGPRLVYSGTLARKHRPDVLADLARAVASLNASVIVISEGEGADQLSAMRAESDELGNLHVLPYQPFDELPMVLGSADVLIVLLEPLAGGFSVPSKTLSYLCAGRAILGCMPPENTAARIITERARAGLVVPAGDSNALCNAALELLQDEQRRNAFGASGRRFAEQNFETEIVVRRFLKATGR